LRKLTEQPIDKNGTLSGAGPDYSKDYTALLLLDKKKMTKY
jgi:hypothetical protein